MRRVDAGVHAPHHGDGFFVTRLGTNDDAVGDVPVSHRPTLAQKLGVGRVAQTRSPQVAVQQAPANPGGHGALHHHDQILGLSCLYPTDRGPDLVEVGRTAVGRWRSGSDHSGGAQRLAHLVAMQETQPAAPHAVADTGFEPGLVEMNPAPLQGCEAVAVDVNAQDRVTGGSQPGGDDGADVTETNDSDFHDGIPRGTLNGCAPWSGVSKGIITTRLLLGNRPPGATGARLSGHLAVSLRPVRQSFRMGVSTERLPPQVRLSSTKEPYP